jgi:hypothetical protein
MGAFTKACSILLVTTCLLLLITPGTISSSPQKFSSSNYQAHYALFNNILTISIQPSLYAYYNNQSHLIPDINQYAKFITPQTVQPIADTIQTLTQNMSNPEEKFANAVLSLVHQIPYNITGAKFPVETLIENKGDCGAVSLLAASIMHAGGLDVVLIKYTTRDFAHMNVGVNLPYAPSSMTLPFGSSSLQFNNKSYWIAEATPQADWRVGDQPLSMLNALIEFIAIDGFEETSPGQVSCSLSSLMPSSITLDVFSKPLDVEVNRSLLITGSSQPNTPNSFVTVYINKNGSSIDFFKTLTDDEGRYSYLWNFTSDGTYYILASYSGNTTYAGVDSKPVVVFIGPPSLVQFQTDTYNYIIGIAVADIAVRPYIGVKNFLNAPLEKNVSFSYKFALLSTGQSATDIETRKITIPERHVIFRDRQGRSQTFEVPAKTRVVPLNIPLGQRPLSLPADFNKTINSQFCFTIQKTSMGNYSLNAVGLDSYDISGIRENSDIVFFNATEGINENKWYNVATEITENGVTLDLQSEYYTPIQSLWALNNESTFQLVLLVANNVDGAIVLKDFKVNDGENPTEATPQIVRQPPPPMKSLLPFAITIVAVAALLIIMGALIDVKKRFNR